MGFVKHDAVQGRAGVELTEKHAETLASWLFHRDKEQRSPDQLMVTLGAIPDGIAQPSFFTTARHVGLQRHHDGGARARQASR